MKKKFLAVIVMFFVVCTCFFTGCSCNDKGLTDNPPTDANVISNGGMTVVKGDYLYYVNGYLDTTTLTDKDNKLGKVEHTGIYRTKLVNGDIVKDKDGFVANTELVVSKVVGFSNGGFYIIDDYIYYTTPYMNYSSDGTLQTDRVEFHRININGTKDEKLYETAKAESNLDWTIYKVGDTAYIVTYCDSKLIIFNTTTKTAVAEIENTTSRALFNNTDYKTGEVNTEFQNFIYYTRDKEDADGLSGDFKGNVVCKVNIATGEIITLEKSKDYTYTIKEVTENSIYYTKTNSTIGGLELLYKKNIESIWNVTEISLTNVAYTNYYFSNYGDNLVIATSSSATYIIENQTSKKVLSTAKTVVGVYGNYVYYVDSSVLYRFNIRGEMTDGEIATEKMVSDEYTYTITDARFLDFDNKRLYVYRQYTSASESTNYYLNYINETDKTQRFVGKFEDSDIPAVPEQKEDYGDDPEVEYTPHID